MKGNRVLKSTLLLMTIMSITSSTYAGPSNPPAIHLIR
jgi:hypothetical protein